MAAGQNQACYAAMTAPTNDASETPRYCSSTNRAIVCGIAYQPVLRCILETPAETTSIPSVSNTHTAGAL